MNFLHFDLIDWELKSIQFVRVYICNTTFATLFQIPAFIHLYKAEKKDCQISKRKLFLEDLLHLIKILKFVCN